MLAQISQGYLVGGLVGAGTLSGLVVVIFLKHLANNDRHPNKKDIVFKDVCEKTQDCIEGKLDNIKDTVDERHKDTKKHLERIEDLIRNNGKLRGAIT